MLKRWLSICVVLLLASDLMAQDLTDGQQAIEQIVSLLEGDEERAQIIEELEGLLAQPLDINLATAEELSSIPFFDDFFIRNLLLERSKRNGFLSLYDLKSVQGAPIQILYLLEPFITVRPMEQAVAKGTKQTLYTGADLLLSRKEPLGLAIRYSGERPNWEWYLTTEKDRGEQLLPLRKGGMDFWSGAVAYHQQSTKWIVGDYRVNTGLGLLMGQHISYFSKLSSQMSAPNFRREKVRAHRSFREYNFLRGIATESKLSESLNLLLFAGIEDIDARVEGSSLRTIYLGGMHRTESELTRRKQARREIVGGHIGYHLSDLYIGATGIMYRHKGVGEQRGILLPPARYPQKEFLKQAAIDIYYTGSHVKLFGETLIAPKQRIATQVGITLRGESLGHLTITGRYHGIEQISPYGITDGYYSSGRNERGVQIAWQGELAYNWIGALYLDRFSKLQPERGVGIGGSTHIIARAEYLGKNRSLQTKMRYLQIYQQAPRWSAKLAYQQNIHNSWSMKAILNATKYGGEPLGWASAARLQYKDNARNRWRVEVAIQYFHLTTSSGTISNYLPYQLYQYYTPLLRGTGWAFSTSLQYNPTKTMRLFGRTSHYIYTNSPTSQLPSFIQLGATTTF